MHEEGTGFAQNVHQPTRGGNNTDRDSARTIVLDPNMFDAVRVVTSVARSWIEIDKNALRQNHKTRNIIRPKSPTQNVLAVHFQTTTQRQTLTRFISIAVSLLIQFYQLIKRSGFHNPTNKTKLRRKNRLVRAGRIAEFGSLAEGIGTDMKKCGKIGGKTDDKDMWLAVRKLTGKHHDAPAVDGVMPNRSATNLPPDQMMFVTRCSKSITDITYRRLIFFALSSVTARKTLDVFKALRAHGMSDENEWIKKNICIDFGR